MRRLLFVSVCLFGLVPFVAFAQGSESIASFEVRADVAVDRTMTVTEEITYDFGAQPRHGIFREIPTRYERNGGTYRLHLDVRSVTMDGGEVPWHIEDRSPLTIRIGDPDVTLSGRHVYVITYETDRALNFFDGEAELYWNVTGNAWEVPIAQASFSLRGPEGFLPADAPVACFVGSFGSTEESCTVSANGAVVTVSSDRLLRQAEGMTVVVRFPEGLIAAPTLWDVVWQFILDNWTLGIPILTFLVMFWLWFTRGREPKGKGTVVPHYAPPRKLSPAEMVALRDQQVPHKAATATILDLARRGYVQIEFGEEKGLFQKTSTYTFVKRKAADASLSAAEASILEGLFAEGDRVELTELKGSFHKSVQLFQSAVMTSLQEKQFFGARPSQVRGAYIGVAVALIVVLFWFLLPWMTGVTVAALVLSAVIIASFGYFMPQKTKEGAVALEEVEGFKWFLSVTEKERLAFHNAPERKPSQFHQFLPAAVAFGVEKQWAEQFKGIDIPPPDYATGTVLHHWSAIYFISALGDFGHAASTAAYSPPSSAGAGGSGFSGGGSGGGFGGGGGGSW